MAGAWFVLVLPFDFLVAQRFIPSGVLGSFHIDGWAALLLTTETLGPVLAVALLQVFIVLAVLVMPTLASSELVRVVLTVSVMNAAALTILSIVASGGLSLLITAIALLALATVRAASRLWTRFGPAKTSTRRTGVMAGAVLTTITLITTGGLAVLVSGSGAVVSGCLVAITLRETNRIDPVSGRLVPLPTRRVPATISSR